MRRPEQDARLRTTAARAEQNMIHAPAAMPQLFCQLKHGHNVTCRTYTIRTADGNQIRLAALRAELCIQFG